MTFFDQLAQKVTLHTMAIIQALALTLSLIDFVDITFKIISGVIAIGVGALAYRHYQLKIKLAQKEIELKDQEIYARALENKKKEEKL